MVLALRELALALEESPFVGVRETASQGASSAAAAGGSAPPNASSVAHHQDRRLYLVLSWPGDEEKTGLYVGLWKDMEARLPNRSLAGCGVRLRRVESQAQAQAIWATSPPGRLLREIHL